MITNLEQQLQRDEGLRLSPYLDSRGISSVGYGHNLIANPLPGEVYPLTTARALNILQTDIVRIEGKLEIDLPWVADLPYVYRGVLSNMSFNLGVGGLLEFHDVLNCAKSGQYVLAAAAMKASLWYTQVGARAERLVLQMETGQWV